MRQCVSKETQKKDSNVCIKRPLYALTIIVTGLFIVKQGQHNIKYHPYFSRQWPSAAAYWSTQLYSMKELLMDEIWLSSLA